MRQVNSRFLAQDAYSRYEKLKRRTAAAAVLLLVLVAGGLAWVFVPQPAMASMFDWSKPAGYLTLYTGASFSVTIASVDSADGANVAASRVRTPRAAGVYASLAGQGAGVPSHGRPVRIARRSREGTAKSRRAWDIARPVSSLTSHCAPTPRGGTADRRCVSGQPGTAAPRCTRSSVACVRDAVRAASGQFVTAGWHHAPDRRGADDHAGAAAAMERARWRSPAAHRID